MHIRAFIPTYQKIEIEFEKNFTVFVIDVYVAGRKHVTKKRYSEFEDLHKKLKKLIWTPEFPPKKVLKWNAKNLELRRLGLEVYLQGVLEQDEPPRHVCIFLGITLSNSMESLQIENIASSSHCMTGSSHQSVLAFMGEAFLHEEKDSSSDSITAAVLQGLYSHENPR